MRHYKNFRISLYAATLLLAGVMASCSDPINLTAEDPSKYDGVGKTFGMLENSIAPNASIVDLYAANDTIVQLHLALTKTVDHAVDARLVYDADAAATYNALNGTDFDILPQELVSFEDGGQVVVVPGQIKSAPLTIRITPSASLELGKSYALPVRVEPITGGIEYAVPRNNYIYYIKYQGDRLNPNKGYNFKILSCMEVNDANPLTNGELTMATSGKPFVDIVVMFSGNINYNAETGRAYIACNNNVRALLDNKDKYLKPLQDKGIKVLLGLMGNWDFTGVANMNQATATYFAQEIKSYCEAYGLDGVFYDDEYSSYSSTPPPGFVANSAAGAARLAFETKRAMPDKLCTYFGYSTLSSAPVVDGVNPGQFIDLVAPNYYATSNAANYPGSTIAQMMTGSQEFNRGYTITTSSTYTTARNNGYGGMMIFAMNEVPIGSVTWARQIQLMGYVGQGVWGENVVWSGNAHTKDW